MALYNSLSFFGALHGVHDRREVALYTERSSVRGPFAVRPPSLVLAAFSGAGGEPGVTTEDTTRAGVRQFEMTRRVFCLGPPRLSSARRYPNRARATKASPPRRCNTAAAHAYTDVLPPADESK